MTHHFRGAFAVALLASTPCAVLAQQTAAPAHTASSPATATKTPAPPSAYRSAFEGYRRFDDTKVAPWRESNDLVGRIGGWQAYARESAGGEAAPAADPSQHGGQAMPKKP